VLNSTGIDDQAQRPVWYSMLSYRSGSNRPRPPPACPVSAGSPSTSNAVFAAVTASLSTSWNSGVAEGHVNREMLKGQLFGRAGFALLRKRVPLTP
jgi:hypothetical protein